MIKPRIIPCLLIRDKGLVKTYKFANDKYLGDPINAVKIFNEKLVDELMVIDIDATSKNLEINFELIKKFSEEARMPICYAGGVNELSQVKKIIELGVEKIGISYGGIINPNLIQEAAKLVGSQSIVAILDAKKNFFGGYSVYSHNGTKDTGWKVQDLARKLVNKGAGEIVINSIDNDGAMSGFDHKLIKLIKDNVSVPITVIGGAGSINDMESVLDEFGLIGISAGSMFVFNGKYKAVLINYLSEEEKQKLNLIIEKNIV